MMNNDIRTKRVQPPASPSRTRTLNKHNNLQEHFQYYLIVICAVCLPSHFIS